MPAFNFQQRFASYVESGEKTQTIRTKRKNRPQVGQKAFCYTLMRTKKCRKLGEWEINRVYDVKILQDGVWLNGDALTSSDLDLFAMRDGFTRWEAMRDWFSVTHGLPFSGDLIKWHNAPRQFPARSDGKLDADVGGSSV